jgi:hypothetical protein
MVRSSTLALLAAALVVTGCDSSAPVEPRPAIVDAAPAAVRAPAPGASVRVLATGLEFPRGFTFRGRDIYVAEAGSGGADATDASQCDQVVPPVGPYTNGPTGRISRIDPDGHRSTVASGFPSAVDALGDVNGVSDVAFVGNQLVAMVAGGGCSHGSASVPAGLATVSPSGDWSIVTDLSAYQAAHPVAQPFAGDFEPDGTWYSLIRAFDALFAVEPNHGEVIAIDPRTWRPHRLADVSATQGHIVPTAITDHAGSLFFSNLGTFPIQPGTQKVFQLSRTRGLSVVAEGFTSVLGLDYDAQGRLYVLETSPAPGFPTPGIGRVVRVGGDGDHEVIVDGLFFPTAMRFGPDGRLYISNKGFGPPQPGELLQVVVPGARDPR